MKRILICISLGLLFLFAEKIGAGDVICYDYFVSVDTTGVIASNMLINRKYYLIVNTDSDNIVYHSTNSINADTYAASGAIPIPVNYGYWEDAYYVYKSTWHACTSTGTATIAIREKE